MTRPDSCPNCGETYTLERPETYRKMCVIGTTKEYGGWVFYHE